MGKTVITKFKWFWAWQDEAEERWLKEMSEKGYHLSSVGLPGIYSFLVAEPRNYVYRLDYQIFRKKDKREYLQLFHDAGWEHIGEMSGWQYFRKEANPGETPEIYTDVESKISKYKRLLAYLGFFYIMLIFIFSERILNFGGRILGEDPYPWWGNVQLITLSVLLFFTFAIIKLVLRIRQLKKL